MDFFVDFGLFIVDDWDCFCVCCFFCFQVGDDVMVVLVCFQQFGVCFDCCYMVGFEQGYVIGECDC